MNTEFLYRLVCLADLDDFAISLVKDYLFVVAFGNAACISDCFVLCTEHATRKPFSSDPFFARLEYSGAAEKSGYALNAACFL
jgi:hypothetical protein